MTDDKPDASGKAPSPPEKAKPASQKRSAQSCAARTDPSAGPESQEGDAAVAEGIHATTVSEDAVAESDQAVADSVAKGLDSATVGPAMRTISEAVSGEARRM